MLSISFVDDDGIHQICELARTIWNEYYPCILTTGQIEYMVHSYQSEDAVYRQVHEKGYQYAYIENDGQVIGYTAVCPMKDKLFLSKFYLTKENRGRGLGSAALQEIIAYARSLGKKYIYLTVNKNNELGIRAYTRNGFKSIQSIETDIGQGFVMDDYVMELVL